MRKLLALLAVVALATFGLAASGGGDRYDGGDTTPVVQVWTDEPVRACIGSQYAGMKVQVDRFFAMGSGPIRRS